MCRSCNEESERDTCHVLFCPSERIVACKEDLTEWFLQSLFKLKRDDETLLLLSYVMTNYQHLSPPPRLQGLRRNLHKCGLRSLWYGIFPLSLISAISSDKLQDTLLVSSIIKLSLSTLHRLWLKRCEKVHATLSGDSQREEIASLRNEVREVLHSKVCTPFLPISVIRIKVEDAPVS